MIYTIEKQALYVQRETGERTVLTSFDCTILKLVEFKDSVCVLTEPPPSARKVSNLYKIDNQGQELWRVSPSFASGDKNIFVDIKVDPSNPNQLIVWDWDGNRYLIDVATGATIEKEFMK